MKLIHLSKDTIMSNDKRLFEKLEQIHEGIYPEDKLIPLFRALTRWRIDNFTKDFLYTNAVLYEFYTDTALCYPFTFSLYFKPYMLPIDIHEEIKEFIKTLPLDLNKDQIYERTKEYINTEYRDLTSKQYEDLIKFLIDDLKI